MNPLSLPSKGIESAARGTKSLLSTLSGMGAEEREAREALQSRQGTELIKQLLTGGIALGGGIGAGVALRNQLKALREENEALDENRLDDDTLYIPQTKAAANRWLAPGLGVTGAVLGAGAAYAIVQSINDKIVRSRRKKLLDEAQGQAYKAADGEQAVKSAANMTTSDMITAFPVATALLTAAAAGSVSYAALNKSFPTVKKPKRSGPKRIRLLSQDGAVVDPDDTEIDEEKLAKSASYGDRDDAGLEFLVHWVSAALPKGVTSDILCKAASVGGLDQLSSALDDGGVDAMVSVAQSHGNPSESRRKVAAMALTKSAFMRPTVEALAAAEFVEAVPHLYQAFTREQSEQTLEKVAHVGALLGLSIREDLLGMEKLSAVQGAKWGPDLYESLKAVLKGGGGTLGLEDSELGEEHRELMSDAGSSMSEEVDDHGDEIQMESAEDDLVDSIIAPG